MRIREKTVKKNALNYSNCLSRRSLKHTITAMFQPKFSMASKSLFRLQNQFQSYSGQPPRPNTHTLVPNPHIYLVIVWHKKMLTAPEGWWEVGEIVQVFHFNNQIKMEIVETVEAGRAGQKRAWPGQARELGLDGGGTGCGRGCVPV